MRFVPVLFLLLLGCDEQTSQPPQPFAAAGSVVDEAGLGVVGVTLHFEGFGTATSGLDGAWSKSDLTGRVTVTPAKEGWGFSPGSIDIEEAVTDLTFLASPLTTSLEVVVEWGAVGSSGPNSMTARLVELDANDVTHFGTRLEYPEEDAVFAQALTRDSAEEFGLITMEVPAAVSTDLFIAAVRLNEDGAGEPGQRDPIVWFGQVRDLEIVEGVSTTVQMEDVSWTAPIWTFEDEGDRAAYESGTMTGDKDSTDLEFFIAVTDPFGDRPWDEFVGLNGIGGARGDAEEGAWRVRVICRNELVGQVHDSTCRFWPYLHSDMFNLPDTRFSVPPITTDFTVEWR